MRGLLMLSLIGLGLTFAAPRAQAGSLEVGQQAPCVVLNNIAPNGTESQHCIREPKVAGQLKILEFFSATCSDCTENLPIVSQLAARLDSRATTRLVGLDRDETLLRNYIKAHADLIHFEVALDTGREATQAYGVIETPTIFVLDAQNKVLYRNSGVLAPSDVETIAHIVTGDM